MKTLGASENLSSVGNVSEFPTPSQKQFFFILLIYFGLQTAIRTFISGTVDLDESEQLILTQKFSWGYGSQPPLYTWLQILFFKEFGVSVFALALFKNLLLFCIYIFTYLNARLLTRNHVCGILAAISLLFIPQVSWESQRDLTHSVLASALVAATLFVFFRLREKSWRRYLAFGICIGLGVLSKYNYVVFFVGLILAALSFERFRPLILNKRFWLSLVVGFVLLLPHLFWATENRELLATTAYKFHQQQNNYFSDVGLGLGRLIVAVVFHILPLVMIVLLIFRKNIFSVIRSNDCAKLLFRKYLFILASLILAVLVLRVTGFKDRWFEPIFISAPLLLFLLTENQINRAQMKMFFILGSIVALTVLIIIPSRILLAEEIGRTPLLNAPYSSMEKELDRMLPPEALIIAENKWIGGNLHLLFPNRNVVTPELAKLYSGMNRDCTVIWDATRRETPPRPLLDFVKTFTGRDLQPATAFAEGTYKFHQTKKFRLGIGVVGKPRQEN